MPQRTLIDASGVVVNVIELADGAAFSAPDGLTLGPSGGHIGDRWTGSGYQSPPPPPMSAVGIASVVRSSCDSRIARLFAGRRDSMLSYLAALNAKLIDGATLSPEEQADRALILACDAWEGAMIDKREWLITAGDAAAAVVDATWPPAPAGVTSAWLAGF